MFTGLTDARKHRLINLPEPVGASDAATKGYVDAGQADLPSFRASRASDQTTGTTIIFDTESVDIGAGYNPATGIYTAPRAGVYQFNATVWFENNTGGNSPAYLNLVTSVGSLGVVYHQPVTNGTVLALHIAGCVKLAAGETAYIDTVLNTSTGIHVWGSGFAAVFTGSYLHS